MPGKKKGKSKKKPIEDINRKLELKINGEQEYVKVTKMLGNCRVGAVFPDGKETIVHIPGKFSKYRQKCWITQGDILIVCIRSFQQGKVDMAYKYTPFEIRELRNMNEIPAFFLDRDASHTDGDDGEIDWVRETNEPSPQKKRYESSDSDISDISESDEEIDDI